MVMSWPFSGRQQSNRHDSHIASVLALIPVVLSSVPEPEARRFRLKNLRWGRLFWGIAGGLCLPFATLCPMMAREPGVRRAVNFSAMNS
jgi:hypothetical protein